MMKYLSGQDAKGRLSLSLEIYKQLLLFDKHDSSSIREELKNLVQSSYRELLAKESDYPFLMTKLNLFIGLLSYENYYNPFCKC